MASFLCLANRGQLAIQTCHCRFLLPFTMCIFTAWKALKLKTCTSINSEIPYKKQIALDFSRHIQQDNAVALANANGHQHKFQKELPCTNAKQLPNVNILLGPLSLHFFQQWYTYTYTFKRNLACSLAMTTVPGDDRSAKLRKINDLRAAVPFVSQSSLAAILNFVSKEGLPELKQRGHIREARKIFWTLCLCMDLSCWNALWWMWKAQ